MLHKILIMCNILMLLLVAGCSKVQTTSTSQAVYDKVDLSKDLKRRKNKMYEKNFIKRLGNFGIKKIIISPDTFALVITFFVTYILTKGLIPQDKANEILSIFIEVSASLFAIVLAGLAIVTSFTDKDFIYVWKKLGEFDNIITIFQYNLYVPLAILLYALVLKFIAYNSLAMIILVALFVYMIFSLIDLIGFVSKYGLQRGEFIKQLKELNTEKIETPNTKK